MSTIRISRSRSGQPTLAEKGGGSTNTGWARIIAEPDGSRPHAIYIPRRGSLTCAEHAVIIIRPGMTVIDADHHRGDFRISVNRIDRIDEVSVGSNYASVTLLGEYDQGEWSICFAYIDLASRLPIANNECDLRDALDAAKAKAQCYHCREPHFVEEGMIPEGRVKAAPSLESANGRRP